MPVLLLLLGLLLLAVHYTSTYERVSYAVKEVETCVRVGGGWRRVWGHFRKGVCSVDVVAVSDRYVCMRPTFTHLSVWITNVTCGFARLTPIAASASLPHLLDAVALCSDDVRLHALIIQCCRSLGWAAALLPHRLPQSP